MFFIFIQTPTQRKPKFIFKPGLKPEYNFAPCKGVRPCSLGFWIPSRRFRIPGTRFQVFLSSSGIWFRILIVSGIPDSLSCILDSTAKICWIPDSTSKSFPDSGIRTNNRSFPSSTGPLFQNEGRCSAFDMEIIFHFHACQIKLIFTRKVVHLVSF